MMFLNYLAGELYDDERTTPPCFDQGHTWIQNDWDRDAWDLPVVRKPSDACPTCRQCRLLFDSRN